MSDEINRFEQTCLAEFQPPITVMRPDRWRAPLIFASPHSGRLYPDVFVQNSPLDLITLRQNEDAYMDVLFNCVSALGAPLLAANFPRCFVDVNRAPDEIPRHWIKGKQATTPRANLGLGVIPSIIGEDKPIYHNDLKADILGPRLKALYQPYHAALQTLIDQALGRFGQAILIDCHSMPGLSAGGHARDDIILGDRYGTSCHPATIDLIDYLFSKQGFRVSRNHPYAGSYVTSHYGQPHTHIEAIQIEINRDLYLDKQTLTYTDGAGILFSAIKNILSQIILHFEHDISIAAE